MTIDEFRSSLSSSLPPAGVDPALQALWWAHRGDWHRAHEGVQQHEGIPACDLVHAHLHRQEGDLGNAAYWYRRAGSPVPTTSLSDEWTLIATGLLSPR